MTAPPASGALAPMTVTPIGSRPPGVKLTPVQREQTSGVTARSGLASLAQDALIQSAADILGSGVNPSDRTGSATGLVVGYVQSGKTLSFTTAIALARDNGFPLVIVIAGNKTNLLTQSHDRLSRDLNVDGGEGLPAWKMRKNIRAQDAHDEQLIRQTIASWHDAALEEDERATLLLTVLKQNQRLSSLTTLLRRLNLRDIPVLVIDDEADQASLNTKVQKGQESTTYTRLRNLRDALPCHTYLQYTATPQAPLLINIADTLSPNFVRVLEPGGSYAGGKEFFAPGSPYVRTIPPLDITPDNVPLPPDPPPSLLEAMRDFFIGLSASLITTRTRRSMLIHPSRVRAVHHGSVQWATAVKDEWLRTLGLSAGDPDRAALIVELRSAYDGLARTELAIPSFDEILGKLPRALRNTIVIEFNTNGRPRAPDIHWRDAEGWILVGGQAVDRGFTVDALTVTYMPRGVGMGNADALQQRARFFGYKRPYMGLCRIYLEQDTRDAFEKYVEHEEIMRRELQRIAATGDSLRSWRRRLVLSADLHPCRRTVISDDYTRARPGGGWTQQRGAEMTTEARRANAAAIAKLVQGLPLVDDVTYPATEPTQQHRVVHDVPLLSVVEMLVDYRLEDPRDTAAFTGILVALGEALQRDPNIKVSVYQMRPGARGTGRTVSAEGTLDDGFQQGPTRLAGGGTNYPGDAFFKSADQFSIQLHSYDLSRQSNVVATSAPLVAMNVPRHLAKDWLVQLQAGQPTS
jgi:hypothetical protein